MGQSLGQNSDVIQYYIAYDVSGSVGSIDITNNLQNSLLYLLNTSSKETSINQGSYNNAISFSLYPFGDHPSNRITYNAFTKGNTVSIADIIAQTNKNRLHKYSMLETTLRKIDSEIDNNVNNTGVFIFTDGIFNKSDIKDVNDYIKTKIEVDKLLLRIKKKVGVDKVFIIQTSMMRPDFQFATTVSTPKIEKDSVAISSNYFWIDSRQSVLSNKYNSYLSQFIQLANATISTPPYLPLNTTQEVAITIQEILSNNTNTAEKALNMIRNPSSKSQNNGEFSKLSSQTQKKIIALQSEISYNKTKDYIKAFETIKENLKKDVLLKKDIEDIKKNLTLLSLSGTNKISQNRLDTNDTLFLNVLKEIINELGFDNEIEKLNTNTKINNTEPIKLVPAYHQAAPTVITETVRQAKDWDNFEKMAIEATADYLIKRSKMEITYTFIENMQDYLFTDNSDIELLFPSTKYFVDQKNKTHDILALQDAVKKDIMAIPSNILKHPKFVDNERLYSFWVLMQLNNTLMERGNLEDSFSKLSEKFKNAIEKPTKNSEDDLINKIKQTPTGKALLMSIRLIDYLNKNDFATTYQDLDQAKLEELSKMLVALAIDTDNVNRIVSLKEIQKEIGGIYQNYMMAKSQIKALQNLMKQPPTADFEGYRSYQTDLLMDVLKRTASILTSGSELIRYIEMENVVNPLDSTSYRYSEKMKLLKDLMNNIDFNTYQSKFQELQKRKDLFDSRTWNFLIELKSEKIKDHSNQSIASVKKKIEKVINLQAAARSQELINFLNYGIDAWFQLKEQNYAKAMFTLSEVIVANYQGINKTLSLFLVTSGEIATAKSADDISGIIARHTLPVASHKLKKNSSKSTMLTAYVGWSYALYNKENTVKDKWGLPIMAVIGPEWSLGINKKGSFSIMATLLDLGNIIQFKLGNDSAANNDISLARIFSPGALISYSPLSKWPVAFTGSYMFNPGRFQLGVTLDMPLLGFWKKD